MAGRKGINKKNAPIIALIAIIVLIGSFAAEKLGITDAVNEYASPDYSDSASGETVMTAHFIDVGQGDCTVFISGEETMLVDSGEAEYADTVISALESYGVTKLTYAVATHAHSDHMGGMYDILEAIPTENIIISEPCEDNAGTAVYEKFLDAANNSDADIILAEPSYTFSLGEAECKIIAPFNVDSSEENNNSVIMHITAGTTSFLLTGDAEKAVEKQLISAYPNLRATILKVGHHGSKTSSSEEFVEMLDCEAAVISVGEDNSYGHPTQQVLTTLEENDIACYRTDLSGTVTVSCRKTGYSVSAQE